jgi:hypothetical protein
MEGRRNKAQRLHTTVQLLPQHTREAMLRGIEKNYIIVGGYTDGRGGICPMLAAHRNGGRTSFASFAKAWDAFTGAGRRPRRATRREVHVLRTYLELSLIDDENHGLSMAEIADQIRAERREFAERLAAETPPIEVPDFDDEPIVKVRPGDRNRTRELRGRTRWSWARPARSYDVFEATVAAAQEEYAELRADDVLGEVRDRRSPRPVG